MGIFNGDSSSPKCPSSDTDGPAIRNIVGGLTWHNLSIIIAAATALSSIVIATFLIIMHATHFSNPAEQKQIIRILTIVPSFAGISFLCVWLDGNASLYIAPGRDIGEALPMAAFFLLMSTYVAPDERYRDNHFAGTAQVDKDGYEQKGGSLGWYRTRTFGVLQWVPISLILWVATAISLAVGTYCVTSNNVHFAHIWITIIRAISTIIAITSILGFYKRFKSTLAPRGAFKQLFCFKIIVFLNFIQTLIFSFLRSSGDLHTSKYLTFNDLANGLPSLILCCEMAIIAPFFLVVYSIKPYTLGQIASPENPSSRHGIDHYQGGPLGLYAILQAVNVFDLVVELIKGTKAKFGGQQALLQPQNDYMELSPSHTAYQPSYQPNHRSDYGP